MSLPHVTWIRFVPMRSEHLFQRGIRKSFCGRHEYLPELGGDRTGEECIHCEAEAKTERGVDIRGYWYAPALVLKACEQPEHRRWTRVLYVMTCVAGGKCGVTRTGSSRVSRGSLFEFSRSVSGSSASLEPKFLKQVHHLEEPEFPVVPIITNVWFPSQESRAALLEVLRSLPVEVTPPVIDAPRLHVPPPEEKPLTAAELKQLLASGWFKKEPEPVPPPAAPAAAPDVLAELEQLRRENERLRKEKLQEQQARDAATKIAQDVVDSARKPDPEEFTGEELKLATKGAGAIISQELKASLPDSHPASAASQKARAEARKQERGAA